MRKILVGCSIAAMLNLLFISTINAQKAPMKFGKVDMEYLTMKSYDMDTSAAAVVLCDYGEFNPNSHEFTRHCRIKILKPEGTKYANVRVGIRHEGMVKARSYNLENGEVVVTKMKWGSIFKEKIDGWAVALRFAIPNVKVGSVIEYTYTHSLIPNEWIFQREIPTIWSELRLESTPYLTFNKNFKGYTPLTITEESRWVPKDVPSVRREPYMNSIKNYASKFELIIEEVKIPGFYYENVSHTWDAIRKNLMNSKNFGHKLTGNYFLNSIAKQIETESSDEKERAVKAYNYIKENITWNNYENIYAFDELNVIQKDGIGNSAEINLMLIALLRKMNIQAYPIVLSTRNNGTLSLNYPNVEKLNHVIVEAVVGSETFLLDATEKHAPFGLLPKRDINGLARILYDDETRQRDIQSQAKSFKLSRINAQIKDNGEIEGKCINVYKDFAAYELRKNLDNYVSDNYFIEDLQKEYEGLYIENFEFKNKNDIYKPISYDYEFSIVDAADLIDNKIYLNPFMILRLKENPFKSEERKFPIDFIVPFKENFTITLKKPETFEIESIPANGKVKLPNNKGYYAYQIFENGEFIQLKYEFNIEKTIFNIDEYNVIKAFYDELLKKQSELIILNKKS